METNVNLNFTSGASSASVYNAEELIRVVSEALRGYTEIIAEAKRHINEK